ncbi:hypothetical protein L2E82_50993 [Cichorium intybus]|nr:hypothetical protein L2E82_50993 [Cichorium intybus]
MCKCRSHGTFPLFGLQSSHLNICYYHQDPHRRPLRPGSRPRFCSDRRALLLIGAWHLPRRPGVGRALKRHPFSGLVDSAVVCKGFYPPLDGNCTSWRPARLIRRTGLANDTCLWGPRPLLLVGKQAAGTRVASSPDSDLEAFSHNPAHGSFAPLAFQPSAMTNCANQRFLSY